MQLSIAIKIARLQLQAAQYQPDAPCIIAPRALEFLVQAAERSMVRVNPTGPSLMEALRGSLGEK